MLAEAMDDFGSILGKKGTDDSTEAGQNAAC